VGRQRRLTIVALSALAIAGLVGAGAGAEAAPPSGKVSFSTPRLFPRFSTRLHDYVVRCNDGPVTVQGHASGGWEAKIGNNPFRRGDFSEVVPLSSGRAFTITVRQVDGPQLYRYHVRCLPNNFPTYTFTRYGPVSPKYFSVDRDFNTEDRHFGIIFNDHGVPMWWYDAPTQDTKVLPNGNVLWFDRSFYRWEIHRLDGSLVRTLDAVGPPADPHDLQMLGNGGYLFGAYVPQSHVDTSAYGGSSDATVLNAELLRVSPDGQVAWDWKSQDHIALAETGRFWGRAVNKPTPWGYDIIHWNSIEPAGDSVIASFRHLDAVYKIRRSTGNIVWKLGGTSTPRSLEVENDPRGNTLGAQHDARLLSDGTVTVFDNRTNLGQKKPRAVRFRIDETTGTATLLQSITDPAVPTSYCCGSARRLGNGDWLIGWGRTNPVGGYKPNGERTFLLTPDSGWSYRAEPVGAGVVSAEDLREGMRAMANPG
jgi:hypothetical protein